jgi:hypothetical protein
MSLSRDSIKDMIEIIGISSQIDLEASSSYSTRITLILFEGLDYLKLFIFEIISLIFSNLKIYFQSAFSIYLTSLYLKYSYYFK